MRPRPSPLVLPAAGFAAWAVAFVLIYAGLSVGCALGWDDVRLPGGFSLQRGLLVLLLVVATGTAAMLARALRPRGASTEAGGATQFLRKVGYGAALAALGSTVVCFVPVVFLTICR